MAPCFRALLRIIWLQTRGKAGLGHAGTWFLNSTGPAPKALHTDTDTSLEVAGGRGEQKSKATREVGKHRSPSLQ